VNPELKQAAETRHRKRFHRFMWPQFAWLITALVIGQVVQVAIFGYVSVATTDVHSFHFVLVGSLVSGVLGGGGTLLLYRRWIKWLRADVDTEIAEHTHLRAELVALDRLIADTPEDDVISRASLISRREEVQAEVAGAVVEEREPARLEAAAEKILRGEVR
jgi:hypothetical protein